MDPSLNQSRHSLLSMEALPLVPQLRGDLTKNHQMKHPKPIPTVPFSDSIHKKLRMSQHPPTMNHLLLGQSPLNRTRGHHLLRLDHRLKIPTRYKTLSLQALLRSRHKQWNIRLQHNLYNTQKGILNQEDPSILMVMLGLQVISLQALS